MVLEKSGLYRSRAGLLAAQPSCRLLCGHYCWLQVDWRGRVALLILHAMCEWSSWERRVACVSRVNRRANSFQQAKYKGKPCISNIRRSWRWVYFYSVDQLRGVSGRRLHSRVLSSQTMGTPPSYRGRCRRLCGFPLVLGRVILAHSLYQGLFR